MIPYLLTISKLLGKYKKQKGNKMKIKNIYYFVFAVIACITASFTMSNAAEIEKKEILIVGVNYPPYEFEFPKDDLKGFDVEVTEEAFRRAGIKVRFEFYPWKRAMQMVKEGKVVASITCAKMPGRESFIKFSDPISSMTDIFLVRKDYKGPEINKYSQIKELKMNAGFVMGNAYGQRFDSFGIPYDLSPSHEVALKKLRDRRIDVMPALLENFLYTGRKTNPADRFKWFIIKEDFLVKDFHLCFCKKWPRIEELVNIFNEKLAEMKKDGTYKAIHSRYR
jgi:polar amino acid transport system substrate-binding protein